MKERVKNTYRLYGRKKLIAMLQNQDCLIENLRLELTITKEAEERWKAEAIRPQIENLPTEENQLHDLWQKAWKEDWADLLEKDLEPEQLAWVEKWKQEQMVKHLYMRARKFGRGGLQTEI